VSATVSSSQILLLGTIAGATIFLGLPVGRMRNPNVRLRAALSSMAAGILLFLLFDVLENGFEPVEESASNHSWAALVGYGMLLLGGFVLGFMSLVYYDRWMGNQRSRTFLGPGAASAAEFEQTWVRGLSPGAWLSLLIATGIGVHNFSEGLAIGQSAAGGEIALALALIIGFGLHNATEGFGIVAPMVGGSERPTWRFLALLGLIGGGPTFVGTLVGQAWTSEALSVAFLALAAGSILYVVLELANVNRRLGEKTIVAWALLAGLALGFGTELVLVAAGV
jgi:ZIP family zinc transporter